jgi:FtsP/CotA-like multicopper oxidase with cupredoxin domain
MDERPHGTNRRDFLKAVGLGALGTVAVGGAATTLGLGLTSAEAATEVMALAGTDGYITVPGRGPVYIMVFVPVSPTATVSSLIATYKGHAQHIAPILGFRQNNDIRITLTNLGLVQRPDLTDTHTIHWHGFDVPSPLNDGVPEVSVAVPIGKQVTYFYRPHREGTYMYHCHTEDVEHVQMGLTSIVYVTPTQDGTTMGGFSRFAYNDGDGSTGYDRHFAILLNEIEERQHDADYSIQEFIMTDFDPQYFTLNGRCYPDTVRPNNDTSFRTFNENYSTNDMSQPVSALVQINAGERGLLRLANLGYTIDAMQLPGIPMHVIGQDASLLRNGTGPSAVDTSYWTDTLYMGPGEARDVLFDAPPYNAARPSGSDSVGPYNVYYFKNADWKKLVNKGATGPGGMMTEVRVYPAGTLLPQTSVGQTYV